MAKQHKRIEVVSSVDKPITFYTPSNIPLPALTSLAVTQELQDELLTRRLTLAFNRGIEHERTLTNMPMNDASHAACKMVKEDKPEQSPEYIDVTIRLPKPPDGWGEPEWREMSCKTDVYLSCNLKWNIVGNSSFGGRLFFCRRVWTPPANAVGTFYWHCLDHWHFTNGEVTQSISGAWTADNCRFVPATVFADFTEPPERKPYRVDRGVVGKDGAT